MGGYSLSFLFYGPMAMLILLPFDLRREHPLYYVIYGIGVLISLAFLHRQMKKMVNGCYFRLTAEVLELGREPKTVVRLEKVVEVLPVAYVFRPFQKPKAEVNQEGFNLILLKMRDGSRLPLVPVSNTVGFDDFFRALYDRFIASSAAFSPLVPEDIEVLRPRYLNSLRPGA